MEYEDYMAQLSNAGVIPTAPRVAGSGGASNLEQRAYQTYMNEMQRLMAQDQPRPVGSGSTSDAEFEAYRGSLPQPQPASNLTDFFINLGTKLGGR